MKYYLIIGYHLKEKNKHFPTIRVYLDDNFIADFECDNEKTIQAESYQYRINQYLLTGSEHTWKEIFRTQKIADTVPCKFKTFELNAESWTDNHKLCIEILNNNSNYMNGFMNKRSLVGLRPIYLIPKMLYDNEKKLRKLLIKSYVANTKLFIDENLNKWTWPGVYDGYPQYFGGNQKIYLEIKKKQKFFIIKSNDLQNISQTGFPQIHDFFFSWLNAYSGKQRHLKHIQKIIFNEGRKNKHFFDILEKAEPDKK